jgi:hypothetical protein
MRDLQSSKLIWLKGWLFVWLCMPCAGADLLELAFVSKQPVFWTHSVSRAADFGARGGQLSAATPKERWDQQQASRADAPRRAAAQRASAALILGVPFLVGFLWQLLIGRRVGDRSSNLSTLGAFLVSYVVMVAGLLAVDPHGTGSSIAAAAILLPWYWAIVMLMVWLGMGLAKLLSRLKQ